MSVSAIGLENCSRSFQLILLRIRRQFCLPLELLYGCIQLISYIRIHLITEKLACRSDDLFPRNSNLAILVQIQAIRRSLINRGRSKGFRLLDGLHLVDDVDNFFRRAKNAADVGKKKVGHKAALHNFSCVDTARNCENLLRIKLYHRAVIIFAVNREEVQQFSDVLLAAVKIALVTGGFGDQVIGKLLKNRKVRAGSKSNT